MLRLVATEPINAEKVLLYLSYLIFIFRKQMIQAASTNLFNPLVPKAYNSECQNILFFYFILFYSLYKLSQ